MAPTISFMAEQFDLFNRNYFDGKLPTPRFAISHARTFIGQFVYSKRASWFGLRRKPADFTIRLSDYYDVPMRLLQNTMLHEMIHYYIRYEGIRDTSAHGVEFRRMMNSLNSRGWEISVSTNMTVFQSAAYAKHVKSRRVLLLRNANGRHFVTVVSDKAVPFIEDRIKHVPDIVSHEWYTSADDRFSRFPAVRSLRAKPITQAVYEELQQLLTNH